METFILNARLEHWIQPLKIDLIVVSCTWSLRVDTEIRALRNGTSTGIVAGRANYSQNSQSFWRRSRSENIHLNPQQPGPRRRTRKSSRRIRRVFFSLRQDSLHSDGEARNYFWSISGNYIYRHHVESRVKLHVPTEESSLIPLKDIDVTRTTDTTSDVMSEKHIEDYWNVDGDRDLSDAWTGFTRFTIIGRKTT